MAMKTRKFYCHKCGEELTVQPRTRIITRSDPDYNKHNRIGRTHISGNVELTEYDFFCRSCKRTIPFSEQRVIEKIQKKLGKRILSQEEISENTEKAKAELERKDKIIEAISAATFLILIVVIYYLSSTGSFPFEFYF